jgi:glycosyltransferase involved in cell wall biosynthesis
MVDVRYDHQIFSLQRAGGISRMFADLIEEFRDPAQGVNAYVKAPFSLNEHLRQGDTSKNTWPHAALQSTAVRYLGNFIADSILSASTSVWHATYYGNFDRVRKQSPLVVTCHDMIPEIFYGNTGCRITLNRAWYFQNADAIACVSENTREDLVKFYNVERSKTTVIYNGVNPSRFSEDGKGEQNPILNKGFILYVGQRGGYKNFDTLVDALKILSEGGLDVGLVAVGGGRFSKEELLRFEQKGVSGRIRHERPSDEKLGHLYRSALAFVYPSKYEGFGLPLLEAFSQGCPVIAANASCFPEIAQDGAVFFDPNSVEQLVKQIDNVCRQKPVNIIERAYQISRGLTTGRMAREYADLYRSVAS